MLTNPENARKLVNDLWQQAQSHIDEAKLVITRSRDRFEARVHQLKGEPNKIIHNLGHKVLKLSDENSQYVPDMFQVPLDRFNNRVAGLLHLERSKPVPASAKKKVESPAPVAKPVTKAVTKPAPKAIAKAASPAKKKAARKTTKTTKTTKKKTAGAAKKKTKAAKTTRKKAAKKKKRS